MDRNAWYASATVTFCGEKTVALMLWTLPPKMNRLPVSSPITRMRSGRSTSSRLNETRSLPARGSYSTPVSNCDRPEVSPIGFPFGPSLMPGTGAPGPPGGASSGEPGPGGVAGAPGGDPGGRGVLRGWAQAVLLARAIAAVDTSRVLRTWDLIVGFGRPTGPSGQPEWWELACRP